MPVALHQRYRRNGFLSGVPGGRQFLGDVDCAVAGLGHYADGAEVSPTGSPQPPAYESAVAPPLGPGGATYYDDNAWVGLDFVHAYLFTSNPSDLALLKMNSTSTSRGGTRAPPTLVRAGSFGRMWRTASAM